MGLGRYRQLEPYSEVDEDFSWQIPRQWSLEDASTVPYFYIQVPISSWQAQNPLVNT